MEKGGLTKTGKALIALIGVIVLMGIIRGGMKTRAISGSIGIIGGADGPTAIFVTAKPNAIMLVGMIGILGAILFLASIVIIFMLIVKKKTKK